MPVQRNDDSQTDGSFSRGYGDDKECDDLAVKGTELPSEGDKAQIHGVEHDLDRQQDRSDSASGRRLLQWRTGWPRRSGNGRAESLLVFPPRKDDRADHRHEDENRRRFEREHVVGEQRPPEPRTELTVSDPARAPTGPRYAAVTSAQTSWTTSSSASRAPNRANAGCRKDAFDPTRPHLPGFEA